MKVSHGIRFKFVIVDLNILFDSYMQENFDLFMLHSAVKFSSVFSSTRLTTNRIVYLVKNCINNKNFLRWFYGSYGVSSLRFISPSIGKISFSSGRTNRNFSVIFYFV